MNKKNKKEKEPCCAEKDVCSIDCAPSKKNDSKSEDDCDYGGCCS